MEGRLTQPKAGKRACTGAKAVVGDLGADIDTRLAGGTRNAGDEMLVAVKAPVLAPLTKNLARLAEEGRRVKRGYTAPIHALNGAAMRLAELGRLDASGGQGVSAPEAAIQVITRGWKRRVAVFRLA